MAVFPPTFSTVTLLFKHSPKGSLKTSLMAVTMLEGVRFRVLTQPAPGSVQLPLRSQSPIRNLFWQ